MTSPVFGSSMQRVGRMLRSVGLCAALGLCVIATAGSQDLNRTQFGVVDVYVASDEPLAAWQFELSERDGRMQVVGVEGGDNQVFADAPYFDREAVEGGSADRVIVAAFSLASADTLPVGRTRVARIHVRLGGIAPPAYHLRLVNAGAPDGRPIDAAIAFESQAGRPQ